MHAPELVGWLLVVLCTAAGGLCVLRMRSGEPHRGTAGGEALMAFGMAAMAVPAAVLTPPRWVWVAYAGVFGAAAVTVCCAAARRRDRVAHHAHHLLGMLAMAYMAWSMTAAPPHGATGMAGMAGMGEASPGGAPVLTGVLLVYFAAYVLWAGSRLLPAAALATVGTPAAATGGGRPGGWGARGELALACRLSMGLAMVAMLLAV